MARAFERLSPCGWVGGLSGWPARVDGGTGRRVVPAPQWPPGRPVAAEGGRVRGSVHTLSERPSVHMQVLHILGSNTPQSPAAGMCPYPLCSRQWTGYWPAGLCDQAGCSFDLASVNVPALLLACGVDGRRLARAGGVGALWAKPGALRRPGGGWDCRVDSAHLASVAGVDMQEGMRRGRVALIVGLRAGRERLAHTAGLLTMPGTRGGQRASWRLVQGPMT